MENFLVKFYRFRGLLAILVAKVISKIMFVEMPPISSAAAIITKDNKILSVKLTYLNGYALPGGHIQSGENAEGAIKREVKEETGLTITSLRYFNSYMVEKRFYTTLNISFLAEAKGTITSSGEGKPEWINPRELLENLVYLDNKLAVKDYLNTK